MKGKLISAILLRTLMSTVQIIINVHNV